MQQRELTSYKRCRNRTGHRERQLLKGRVFHSNAEETDCIRPADGGDVFQLGGSAGVPVNWMASSDKMHVPLCQRGRQRQTVEYGEGNSSVQGG